MFFRPICIYYFFLDNLLKFIVNLQPVIKTLIPQHYNLTLFISS